MPFIGRKTDLQALNNQLQAVAKGRGTTRGRAVMVTGRRRVGKSRLAQQFCETASVASVVFQATSGRLAVSERADFIQAITESGLESASLVRDMRPEDWNQALRMLASVLPDDQPSIVVIDEVPWLIAGDNSFEGALQTEWDRHLSAKPVLLLLIGSDQSVMAGLQDHDRPFFGRAAVLRIQPLNPADVMDMIQCSPLDAIDAWLVTGGFPLIAASWQAGESRLDFLARSLANPLSPLLVSAELTLLGEFPRSVQARAVLEAVGTGETTFSRIARSAGGGQPLASGSLSPLLDSLADKQVIASDLPLSTAADTRNRRYRIADPYLRFWLAFGSASLRLAERGLGDVGLARIEASWPSWRGRAVEPLIRSSLERLCLRHDLMGVEVVGGWWNRQNNPEVDLVGADRAPVAKRIGFIGSIKWRDQAGFNSRDYTELVRVAQAVPGGSDASLVAVSATGFEVGLPLAHQWGPQDVVDSWRQ